MFLQKLRCVLLKNKVYDVALLAQKYPDVQIVVIAVRRPIFGSPERCSEFYAYCVPVTMLN